MLAASICRYGQRRGSLFLMAGLFGVFASETVRGKGTRITLVDAGCRRRGRGFPTSTERFLPTRRGGFR